MKLIVTSIAKVLILMISLFQMLFLIFFSQKWGPFDIDLSADCKNNKVNKFFSKFWTPGTSGVDAFAFDWKLYNSWIVPPVHLIADTIRHLELCTAQGTLVVPKWTSAHFWPLLVNSDGKFKTFVIDYVECQTKKFFHLRIT